MYTKTMIVGIDEVGRGPWAGPLVVGAVILGCQIDGITDSKKLSKKRREVLDKEIRDKAAAVGLGWVEPSEIDSLGLAPALELACKRALEQIDLQGVAYHEIIIDGTVNLLKNTSKGQFVTTMKKADLLVASVGAASIVAKVARDEYMARQDEKYPGYGFSMHVGYGTAAHRAAIERNGVTPLHRLSFAPLQKYSPAPTVAGSRKKTVTTKSIGDVAEATASQYLQQNGYRILARNWKTKFCEIDIVAAKNDTVYFVEVKHRKNAKAGGGVAAITPKKLQKMNFAARVYAKAEQLSDTNLQLAVITTYGARPQFEQYILLD